MYYLYLKRTATAIMSQVLKYCNEMQHGIQLMFFQTEMPWNKFQAAHSGSLLLFMYTKKGQTVYTLK